MEFLICLSAVAAVKFNYMFGVDKYIWTNHSKMKMRHYRLTESRVKRIIRHPARAEEGILEGAIAAMQPAEGKKYSEIWVMYVLAHKGGSGDNTFSRHAHPASAGFVKGRCDFSPSAKPGKSHLPLSRKHIASTAPFIADGLERNITAQYFQKHFPRFNGISAFGRSEMKKVKVITAWRYPGRAPERDPVPDSILKEIKNIL